MRNYGVHTFLKIESSVPFVKSAICLQTVRLTGETTIVIGNSYLLYFN